MRWVGIGLVAWLAASAPCGAWAQEEDAHAVSGLDEGRAASLDAEARALFDAGNTAYHAGRFDAALEYFQRSYALSQRPELLYNVASAAERARQDRVALEAYERYVELAPAAPQHTMARNRIEFLRRQLEAEATPPAEESPASEPARSPAEALSLSGGGDADAGPWIVIAVGGAAAIAGAVLLGLGAVDRATVENPPAGARWADSMAAYERGPALETAGAILLPLGGAAIVAGIIWAVAGAGGESPAALRPRGLGVEGVF